MENSNYQNSAVFNISYQNNEWNKAAIYTVKENKKLPSQRVPYDFSNLEKLLRNK